MPLDVQAGMTRTRHVAALTLGLTLTLAAAARDAGAGQRVGHLEPGLLVARGFEAIDVKPTVGGDVTSWWSPSQHFDLGLETGLAFTRFPYSSNDGEPVLGEPGVDGPLRDSLTLLPRMMFGARVRLPAATAIGLSVGATHIVGALGEFSVIPHPTGCVAVEKWFGEGGRVGVRAAFSYVHFWFGDGKGFMASTVALAFTP
jgi:hypothetical protein